MKVDDLSAHVADPERLAALRAVALLDTPSEESFDRLTWLALHCVHAPVSLVSLVDSNRQFFKSCFGLPEPWLSQRETPLSHSFCQYNRIPRTPLIVEDARTHPIFKDNLAVRDLQVIAYLGIPLVTEDGYVLGSFCVIDTKARHWEEEDVAIVEKLAAAVMTEIQLRTEVKARDEAEERLKAEHEELRTAYRRLEVETAERVRASEQLLQKDQMLIQQSRMAAMGEMISNIAHQWRQPLNKLALLAQELPMTYKQGEFNTEYLQASVARMMDAIGHMSKTIDSFGNFFRPDKEKVDFNVVEVVEKTLALLDLTVSRGEIKVTVIPASAPVVKGYPNEYAQVLLNIVINARDAFASGMGGEPAIVIEIGEEEGRSVVTVTDNAGGIAADIIEKVFDPYFTTKGPDKGTGIGLYMSKMIIEKNMGGTLEAGNVPGGARFRIIV